MNFDETVFRMLRKNRMKSYFLAQIPYFPPKIQLNPVLWFMIRPSSFPIYKVKNFRSIVHGARAKKAHSNIKRRHRWYRHSLTFWTWETCRSLWPSACSAASRRPGASACSPAAGSPAATLAVTATRSCSVGSTCRPYGRGGDGGCCGGLRCVGGCRRGRSHGGRDRLQAGDISIS